MNKLSEIEEALKKLELLRLRASTHASISNCQRTMQDWIDSDAEFISKALTQLAALREETRVDVYYCENGKTLEGLGKGALAVLSNLMMKTNADSAEFMIANEKDGEFHFTAKWIKHKDLGKVSETDFVNIAATQTTEKPNE